MADHFRNIQSVSRMTALVCRDRIILIIIMMLDSDCYLSGIVTTLRPGQLLCQHTKCSAAVRADTLLTLSTGVLVPYTCMHDVYLLLDETLDLLIWRYLSSHYITFNV